MEGEHLRKFLDIMIRERNFKRQKKSWNSVRKELHHDVGELYHINTLKEVYDTQQLLYSKFLQLLDHASNFQYDKTLQRLIASDASWIHHGYGDPICAELKNTKLANMDQWEDLFDKTLIPDERSKIMHFKAGKKDLSVWYPTMGRDSINKSKANSSSRRSYSSNRRSNSSKLEEYSEAANRGKCALILADLGKKCLPFLTYKAAMEQLEGKFLDHFPLMTDDIRAQWLLDITPLEGKEDMEKWMSLN